jgi:hypothetical protein
MIRSLSRHFRAIGMRPQHEQEPALPSLKVINVHFQSEYSTNALRKLERLSAALRVERVSGRGVFQSMSAIDNVFVELGRQVVRNDGLGISVRSEEEMIFRTARLIVVTQLERIDQAIRAMAVSHGTAAAGVEAWTRLLDAIPLGKSELRRITHIWLPHRNVDGGTSMQSPSTAYHGALRSAFCELRKLDEIPEIERLLYRGVASTKHPEIAGACEQILVATQVRVDLQAARRMWTARRHWERALGGQ